jgi:hypothetical protein
MKIYIQMILPGGYTDSKEKLWGSLLLYVGQGHNCHQNLSNER